MATSYLTKKLREIDSNLYNENNNPFFTMRQMIFALCEKDLKRTDKIYKYVTFQQQYTNIRTTSVFPYDILIACDNWQICMPVINALMFWSKMRFRVLTPCIFISTDTKRVLLILIKDIENTLRNGALFHFTNVGFSKLSYNDFCEFALACGTAVVF